MASVTARADGLPSDCGATLICSEQRAKQNIDYIQAHDREVTHCDACMLLASPMTSRFPLSLGTE